MSEHKRHYKNKITELLPVPRLELEWIHLDNYEDGMKMHCNYYLIYRFTTGELVYAEMGGTFSDCKPENIVRDGEVVNIPFRDGVHIKNDSIQINLPAFIVYKDVITRLR